MRQLTFNEIIQGCFSLYKEHFLTLMLIYVLPLFPVAFLQLMALSNNEMAFYWILLALQLLLATLAYAAITVTLSDICIGNKPSIIRSYKYIFGPIVGKLLGTNILQLVVIIGGLLVLVIPGLIFMIWLIFVPIVVVLENTSGVEALKRSKALGANFYLRTIGLIIVMVIMFGVLGGIIGGLLGAMGMRADSLEFNVVISAFQHLIQPIVLIMLVLSYYDIRVRKEAYDTSTLAEDLQH